MKTLPRLPVALAIALLLAPPLAIAGGYTYLPIAFPGATVTYPTALNNRGDIAGTYNVTVNHTLVSHGFIFADGRYTTLDPPGSTLTLVNGINDARMVIGTYIDGATGRTDGFTEHAGQFTRLDRPGYGTDLQALNNRGEAVGIAVLHQYAQVDVFTDLNGLLTRLPFHGFDAGLIGVNDAGTIIGIQYPAVTGPGIYGSFAGGRFTPQLCPYGSVTDLAGINNAGDTVGAYQDPITYATLGFHESGGVFTQVIDASQMNTLPTSINRQGDIIATGYTGIQPSEVFVDHHGIRTFLLPPGAAYADGGQLNDAGQVLLFVTNPDFTVGYFLATPQ